MSDSDNGGFWETVRGSSKGLQTFVVVVIVLALAVSILMKAAGGRWPWEYSHPVADPKPSTTNPPAPAQKESPAPQSHLESVTPEFLEKDPITHLPFEDDILFVIGEHVDPSKLEGGDAKTPGHPWSLSWTAPGPVVAVHMDVNPGWEGEHPCTKHYNVATCTGWINGGNPKRTMHVQWFQRADGKPYVPPA